MLMEIYYISLNKKIIIIIFLDLQWYNSSLLTLSWTVFFTVAWLALNCFVYLNFVFTVETPVLDTIWPSYSSWSHSRETSKPHVGWLLLTWDQVITWRRLRATWSDLGWPEPKYPSQVTRIWVRGYTLNYDAQGWKVATLSVASSGGPPLK